MRWYQIASALLALAACGTPQEQCIRLNTHDLIVLDRLIAETQGNITRGFAYVDTVETVPVFVPCFSPALPGNPNPTPHTCLDDREQTVRRPAAINLDAEAAKLASMRKRRDQMARELAPVVADCKARYPE
ncbi:hypothetical protein GC209_02830 [bacterium]|nr:hypothetical protein [bacterium]